MPGGEAFSVLPAAGALIISALTLLFGPRVPRVALAVLGPLGAAMIGVAIATTTGYSDSAVLYMWPAVWMAFFFGTWGTAFIIGWIGAVHGAVLLSLPAAQSTMDRWIDVVVAVLVVAGVVRVLAARNERLVDKLVDEARVDPLTGLLNRRGLEERMQAEIARAAREGTPLGAVVFDLDHFKDVNDDPRPRARRPGAGVARRAAQGAGARRRRRRPRGRRGVRRAAAARGPGRGRHVRRAGAPRGRHRGAGRRARAHGARRLAAADGQRRRGLGGRRRSTASSLLAAADQALYAAKHSGRNRTVVGPRASGARALGAAV